MPLTITVDESPPGTGKTFNAILRAVSQPARYLFVTERIESINELESRIFATARQMNRTMTVAIIASDTAQRGYSVRQEVESLTEKYAEAGHVIAICTHAAMMMSDFSAFAGWHIIVDEVPAVLDTQELYSMLDVRFFDEHFRLEPISPEWSSVTLTDAGRAIDGSQLQSDDSHRHLRIFHRRVTDASTGSNPRPVICNLQSWEQMSALNTKWIWGSLFSIRQLEAFESITFLANQFMASIAAKLLRGMDPDVIWTVRNTSRGQTFADRRVSIRYFAQSHHATKYFLEGEEGRENLAKIAAHVGAQAEPGKFIWTCNDFARRSLNGHLPANSWLRPKQAGADNLMHCDQALMIYSAKPTPNIHALINAFGITSQDWITSNEYEVILQFVTRTSIRSLNNGQPVTVWLYDEDQARYLCDYLATLPHVACDVEFVDLGLKEATQRGRPRLAMTPEEAEAKRIANLEKRARLARERRALKRAA